MGGSFGDKGSGPGATGKRPAPTIEGTATEVTEEAESETDAAQADAPKAETETVSASDDDGADETTDTEAPETKATPEPAPRRSSGASGVISGLAAGLLGGLAGAGALALAWGYLPADEPTPPPDLAPLEDRIAKLEEAPASQDDDAALADLEARLSDLEAGDSETPPEVAKLADRVSQLEASFASMAEAAKEGGSVADAAAISQQIGEAEQRLAKRIDATLEEAKTANAAALESLKKEIAALDAKLKALTEAELGSAEVAELIPEIGMLDERLAKIEEAIPPLVDELDKDAADTKAATLAIAFANLRAAVDEGRPYASELATLAVLSPGAGDLGRLLDYEEKGIPTVPELTRSFEETKDEALAAPAAEAGGSLVDRLVASAESLVKIRRVGAEAEGDTPDAVLARAEADLDQGELAAAVQEVETLTGAPREAFATWLDQAHARLDADATLQKLQGILLVSLGGSEEPKETGEQN